MNNINDDSEELSTTILPPITLNYKTIFEDKKRYSSEICVLNSDKGVNIQFDISEAEDYNILICIEIMNKTIFEEFKLYLDVNGIIHQATNMNNAYIRENPQEFFFETGKINNFFKKKNLITIRLIILYKFYSNPRSVKRGLELDLYNQECTDFTITTDNCKINVHKVVLYNSSPVFKAMIDSNMKERITNNINFYGWNVNVVKEFINYIYGKKYNLVAGVQDLFQLAHLYQFKNLEKECEKFMIHFMNVKDVVNTLKLLEIHWLKELEAETYKFIESKGSELLKDENFIQYYLRDSINTMNINARFKFVMCCTIEDYKNEIKQFIINNAEEVFANNKFKQLLIHNPLWCFELSKYMSIKLKEKSLQIAESEDDSPGCSPKKRKV